MKLIDTSSWIQQLRKGGSPDVRSRVEQLLLNGEAAWCAPVRLELWSGVGRDPERKILKRYAEVLPDVSVTSETWHLAERLAERGRRNGLRAPAMDILIAACARFHDLEIEHNDAHFDWLMRI
jgi:predicted nucleic acid-binding protein